MPGVGGISIANNLLSNQISLNLNSNQEKLKTLADQLSTGLRVNTAKDDPSGYARATTLQAEVDGFDAATRNIQDANNAATVAQGALQSVTDILSRLRTLAIQGSSDISSQTDRNTIQVEINQLTQEVNTIASGTNFNNVNLLDGSHAGFQASQSATLNIQSNTALASGLGNLVQTVTISANSNTSVDGTFQIQVVNGVTSATTPSIIINYITSAGNVGTQLTLVSFASAGFTFTAAGLGTIFIGTVSNGDIGSTAFIKEAQYVTAVNATATSSALNFQTGDNEGNVVQISLGNVSAANLRIANLNVSATNASFNTLAAEDAIGQVDRALQSILQTAANLGAVSNRLDVAADNNNIASVNLQASESSIRDLNVAQASAQYTSLQILVQAGSSLLSQANTNAQSVLGLFR